MNPWTTLLRQVHPNFIPDGQLTSQAFIPFPKDSGRLSVYDGDQITPEQSYRHYTQVLGYPSHSVWGVTCQEAQDIGLRSEPEPKPEFPSHAIIDFEDRPDRELRKLAKLLKAKAIERGCQYLPGLGMDDASA